jgi:hypothetical protein
MTRSAESLFHEFGANAAADVAMSLLRAKDALLHLALMAAHLGEGQIVDGLTLAALIDDDLAGLGTVASADSEEAGTSAAEGVLRRWVKRAWVHRSIDPETRIERYQLTSGASRAVRQVRDLQQPGSTATESALSMVMAEMRRIAGQANPDPAARIRMLDEQIHALAAQREALEAGEMPVVDQAELADRLAALAQLIQRIPIDLARYGEQMHANTAALLRQSLTDDPAEFAETLARMFDGHDVIAESQEGQAFRAFTNLIGMPSQRAQLEADIGEILMRLDQITPHLAEVLSVFIDTMWQRVQEVERVRQAAFRRISVFVRGGDALHYRSMRTRITEAQAAAALAFRSAHGGRDIGFSVPLSGVVTASVGRLRLDEGMSVPPEPVSDYSGEFIIDPSELAGREAIDWVALRAAVHKALDAHGGFATLPEVLAQLPSPRTGDVIGVWSLAARHGEVDDSASEMVWAQTSRGQRQLTVPYLVFAGLLPGPPAAGTYRRRLGHEQRGVMTLDLESHSDG